jgi:hypothetical protein
VTLLLADSKNKDRSLAAYVISFLAASLAATLAVGHTAGRWLLDTLVPNLYSASLVAFCRNTMAVLVSSNEKSWMHQNTQGNSKTFRSSNFLFFSADFSPVLDHRWNKTSYWQHE